MLRKEISVIKNEILSKGFLGLIWVVFAGLNMFRTQLSNHIYGKILIIVVYTIAILVSLLTLVLKTEKKDEMANQHLDKAKSNVFDFMLLVTIVTLMIGFVFEMEINMFCLLSLAVGISQLATCILFVKYEKEGI